MAKNSCVLYPEAPNGQESRLYKDLLKTIKDRPLTNWIYSAYLASNLGDIMDNAGVARNTQGEHDATDVLKQIEWGTIQSEMSNLALAEAQLGAVDNNGLRVDYMDAKEALEKADKFNDTYKGLTATVVQHGDVYNIIAAEKNARTHTYGQSVKEKLKIWEVYKQVFNNVGIDIEKMPTELATTFSAYNIGLVNHLRNLQNLPTEYLYRKDALILFHLDADSPQAQRLVESFGSLEDAAQAIDNINHGVGQYTSGQKTLLARAIAHAKTMHGIDIKALQTQVDQMSQQVLAQSPEEEIKQTLYKLNKQYNININEIHRATEDIRTLSEAAAEAAIVLQRQIRQLKNEKGNNAEGRKLEGILNQVMKELNNKKYYSGILKFLEEASVQIAEIDNMVMRMPTTGTELEKAFKTARILQDIKALKQQYYPLVSALANKTLTIDESIGQEDITNIRQTAEKLQNFFDKKKGVLDKWTEGTMINLMTQIIGNTTPDGQAVINAIRMAAADSSMVDYLYSVGRASNPVIAAMGTIIRNAQDSRDEQINHIALRIRRATDKLYKSGSNTEFMYENDGHIASDIDWELYRYARDAAYKSFYKQGLRGFDLKEAMELWEDANTEDRVVDQTTGRTEKVPDEQYRKARDFQKDWTQEQKEYYDTMMQLKGEIGTLLPAYAQKQYLPPQLRRNMIDALSKARSIQEAYRAIANKVKNLWTIREDDINYAKNGIIDGQEYQITESAFDNTQLRQIPIFYINRVQGGELLKDFSAGIQALAGTAINYNAMNKVTQVVEFIGDFTKGMTARDKDPKADVVENKMIRVFKSLKKHGKNTNTEDLVQGFVDQHLYGQRQKEQGPWAKLWGNIIAYTSFKGLATNIKGALSNYLTGEFQMMIEAGAGEFYDLKDYVWAHLKLFGSSGIKGDFAELITNNVSHKGVLFREMFDPLNENFTDKSHTRYHTSLFRQLLARDCSFIGYSSGEYLIHYVNMYSILNHEKVLLNGRVTNLYNAFEVTPKQDGNAELVLKDGVTTLDGETITSEWLDSVRKKIRYVNQTTHGSMNAEDKGLIHQRWWGRGIMNFRQWMVEHYSRRFRKKHFDASLGEVREGYWQSIPELLLNEKTKDTWKEGHKADALGMFIKDFITFTLRAQSQWTNLTEVQKYNAKRVHAEMSIFIALIGMSFALGEPDEHKKNFWRRWWIYQTKRQIQEMEASMPNPRIINSGITILQAPMASINTLNSLLYLWYGIVNGDTTTEIKSGPHKGENKYWRNVKKYVLPFYKDWEQMQNISEDDAIFQVFSDTPSNH